MNFSEFEFIRSIGKGSFGEVKLAKYRNIFLAVKFIIKEDIIKTRQVTHVDKERVLLSQIKFPFIVNMIGFTHDPVYLYIIMECVLGGEIYSHLVRHKRFPDSTAKFFAAQIASAFRYLHGRDIIHRDLKPENVLLNEDGYIKLADFGFAKIVGTKTRTFTICGTPEYIAPEILLNRGHDRKVDWWSFGVVLFEFIDGQPPFCDHKPKNVYHKIIAGKVHFTKHFSSESKSLIKKLLTAKGDSFSSDDVVGHRWFKSINFDDLENKRIEPPFRPTVMNPGDTQNFEKLKTNKASPKPVDRAVDPFYELGW